MSETTFQTPEIVQPTPPAQQAPAEVAVAASVPPLHPVALAEQLTTTDVIAADAQVADPEAFAAEPAAPTEYPEGAPKFRSMHRMPWGVRGRAAKRWDAVIEYQKAYPEIGEYEKVRAAAVAQGVEPAESDVDVEVMCDLLEVIDQFMAAVAVDPVEYENWPDRYDPVVFSQAFQAYQDAGQPGEASSSSS
jgi:hypothetical protein